MYNKSEAANCNTWKVKHHLLYFGLEKKALFMLKLTRNSIEYCTNSLLERTVYCAELLIFNAFVENFQTLQNSW